MKYNNKVAETRKKNGMTQLQLAKKANTSVTQIQNIEYGDSAPNVYLAKRIATILNSTVEDLFGANSSTPIIAQPK